MAIPVAALHAFARMDTRKQVLTLKRVGIDTEASYIVLGHLAGNHPDRFSVLMSALRWEEL